MELLVKKVPLKNLSFISIHVLLKGYYQFLCFGKKEIQYLNIMLATSPNIFMEPNPLLAQF